MDTAYKISVNKCLPAAVCYVQLVYDISLYFDFIKTTEHFHQLIDFILKGSVSPILIVIINSLLERIIIMFRH